jgi:hypothetical protein
MLTNGSESGRPGPEEMLDEQRTGNFLAILLAVGVVGSLDSTNQVQLLAG